MGEVADEAGDGLELRVVGADHHLEQCELDTTRHHASRAHAPDANLATRHCAARDRVECDVCLATTAENVGNGLLHADVRLDATDNDLVAAKLVELRDDFGRAERRERALLDRLHTGQPLSEFFDRIAEALRVLLGDDDRHVECDTTSDQCIDVSDHRVPASDVRSKLLLHIDDEQEGAVLGEAVGYVTHGGTVASAGFTRP